MDIPAKAKFKSMTKAKIRPTCSFSITCNTFQSSALHTNCTQKTHKTNIVSFKTINFFDGRFWIYVAQKHLKPHKKLLWAKTLHYPIQKAPHSFPNLTFRKWKFAIDLFHTNSPAHGHSSKHEIKVSQPQTLGLPVASVSLTTKVSPVPFTQTAQVTQKTHKTNIVSLQIILFLVADSGFTFHTNISNHKKSLWGPKHYNISAKEHLTVSQIWPLQNWIFRRTYFTPTRPRIGFPANAKFKSMTKAKIWQTCSFSITCNTFQSSVLYSNCTGHTENPQNQHRLIQDNIIFWRQILDLRCSETPQTTQAFVGQNTTLSHPESTSLFPKSDFWENGRLQLMSSIPTRPHMGIPANAKFKSMTKAKIRPTCSFSITCNTFQSSALHTNCTQKTHKTNIVSFKTINFFDGRFWIYVAQKHLKPHKKLLWAKTLHYPIQKAPHSFPNLTFRKWKLAIDLFHTNSPAHGHSSKHEIKVSQPQTLCLPVASVSLTTKVSPVPFTQTAQVTQKTHKTNIVSLQIILFLVADSGFTFHTNISNDKKSLWGPKHYNISAKEHLTVSQIWPLQNWIFRRTYFTPTRPRIGFPANAKFKSMTKAKIWQTCSFSITCNTFQSSVLYSNCNRSHRKPTKPTSSHSRQYYIFDGRFWIYVAQKHLKPHKLLWAKTLHYPIQKAPHSFPNLTFGKMEDCNWCLPYQLGRTWAFQQTQNSKVWQKQRLDQAVASASLATRFSPVPFTQTAHRKPTKPTSSHSRQ